MYKSYTEWLLEDADRRKRTIFVVSELVAMVSMVCVAVLVIVSIFAPETQREFDQLVLAALICVVIAVVSSVAHWNTDAKLWREYTNYADKKVQEMLDQLKKSLRTSDHE